jgi:hypothetical protein
MMSRPPRRSKYLDDLYRPADTTFLINFGSKRLRPIRLNLPKPPPLNYIAGYGKLPTEQVFERFEIPEKIQKLELECLSQEKATQYAAQQDFWEQLKKRSKELREEIEQMKKFIWHMHYGYWFFNDGKPTYISGWNFSYLNMHWMTLRKGEGYPEYDERQRRRFLFRKYIYETDETFADIDENGRAIKVNGRYRMKKMGKRVFVGTIEPKGRREGLTNETIHIILRILSETYGSDNLGTIVSLDGDNAGTHFKKKLVPAFKRWPIWLQPMWRGGITEVLFDAPKNELIPPVRPLGSSVNYTDSGGDVANDGKKIMAALFDEQGKGKRTGDVGNRWQINRETMTLEAGDDILGFCIHPSTVEKMEEGGQDYKEMCDISDFYTREANGQTFSGLTISYMPSSFALRGFMNKFGNPILTRPSNRDIALGYKKEIGSQTYIMRRRRQLYDEHDNKKMDEYRSFVRKYPEDYDDCWKGVSGYIGFPIEDIENTILENEVNVPWSKGRLEWVNNNKFGIVEFVDDENGHWYVHKEPGTNERNLKTTMEYFSAMEDDLIPMFRPLFPTRGMIGLDPHEFNNKGQSVMLKGKMTKLSDTGIVVMQNRDKKIDKSDLDKKSWTSKKAIACYDGRMDSNYDVAEEALKAGIFWGYLINLERNKSEVWSHLIKWTYGGYLNHKAEMLPDGTIQVDPLPGTAMTAGSKKRLFSIMKDHLNFHARVEPLNPLLKEALAISSMEELTKFDKLAAWMSALDGLQSIYPEIMENSGDSDNFVQIDLKGRAV